MSSFIDSPLTLAIDPAAVGLAGLTGLIVGGIISWLIIAAATGKSIRTARAERESIIDKAKNEAQSAARTIESEAERRADEKRAATERNGQTGGFINMTITINSLAPCSHLFACP